jgi:alpha-L-rhamnosidase
VIMRDRRSTEFDYSSLDDDRLLWDSGRVEGDDSLHVEYDGPPLQSSTRYYWRVAVWDADG